MPFDPRRAVSCFASSLVAFGHGLWTPHSPIRATSCINPAPAGLAAGLGPGERPMDVARRRFLAAADAVLRRDVALLSESETETLGRIAALQPLAQARYIHRRGTTSPTHQ